MGTVDSEELLVRRARNGDRRSYETLVKLYYRRIVEIVRRFVQNPDDAADLTQEVFLRAYVGLPGFRGEARFFTWLYAIAVNAAKNYLATRGRELAAGALFAKDEADAADSPRLSDWETPETLQLGDELREVISRAIDALPRELRAVFVLREIELLSYRQIADRVECPVGTVRSRLFRARSAIKAGMVIDK